MVRGNALAIAVAAGLVALAVPARLVFAQDDPEEEAGAEVDEAAGEAGAEADAEAKAPAAPAAPRRTAEQIERARARALTPAHQPTLPRYDDTPAAGSAVPRTARPRERTADRTADRATDRQAAAEVRTRHREEDAASSTVLSVLLWALAAVVLALVAIWLARELWPRRDPALASADEAQAPSAAETAAVIDRPLGDADELAGRGAYAEAIHALLLRTLGELARTAAVRVERSHTSREILARVSLHADARDALAGLITAVEVTHFGDEPATAADYDRCRQQFQRFAAAFRAGGPTARPRPPAQPAEGAVPA